jgi:hypothetical protein
MEPATEKPGTVCPRCGGDNRCGIASDQPCWCATEFAATLAVPKAVTGCYCRRCLTDLMEEPRRAPAGSSGNAI